MYVSSEPNLHSCALVQLLLSPCWCAIGSASQAEPKVSGSLLFQCFRKQSTASWIDQVTACASEHGGIFRLSEFLHGVTYPCSCVCTCLFKHQSFVVLSNGPKQNLLPCITCLSIQLISSELGVLIAVSPRVSATPQSSLPNSPPHALANTSMATEHVNFRTCSFSEMFSSSKTVIELAPFCSGVLRLLSSSFDAFLLELSDAAYVLESCCFPDPVPGTRSASSATTRIEIADPPLDRSNCSIPGPSLGLLDASVLAYCVRSSLMILLIKSPVVWFSETGICSCRALSASCLLLIFANPESGSSCSPSFE